jgi:hypothetical protein
MSVFRSFMTEISVVDLDPDFGRIRKFKLDPDPENIILDPGSSVSRKLRIGNELNINYPL